LTSKSTSEHILLPIGYIRKPHGLKGEVKVHLYRDKYSQILETIDSVLIEPTLYLVETVRWQHDCALVKFKGIDDATSADRLKTLIVSIKLDTNDDRLIPEGLFIPEQWIDYRVFDSKNNPLGTVKEVIYTKCNDVISVINEQEEILIPVTEEYIISENHENKSIIVKNPEYV